MRKILPLLVLLMVCPVQGADRVTGLGFATRSEVIARHAMAATSQPLATQVALDILKGGGNAVDAAIAANAVIGLMEPTGNGIGGDLFAMVWDAKGQELTGFNGSGRSPKGLTARWFKDNGYWKIPAYGPLSVSVPGAVDGWFKLHERYGSQPMQTLLAPAIRYAREGFPVSEVIADAWAESVPTLKPYPGFLEQFTLNGKAPIKGQIWKNPNLANTLEIIALEGRDGFYTGPVAQTIASYITKNGGFLSVEDLASHQGNWETPVSTNYRGYDIWELPPSGQGIAALQILNILEGFDLKTAGFGSADHLHYFVEAKKLAFEDRARFYADPNFSAVPVAGLISKAYANQRRTLIKSHVAADKYRAGKPLLENGDTIYLSVADPEGNMVSLIQSNYRGMGSGMTPPGLGFILQDRGELFSLDPDHPNAFEPGKRPFHTIIPAFITKDGKPWVSFGLMGGAMQPQGHAQIVMNLVDFGMNLQEAGDAPRIRHSGSPQPTGGHMRRGGTVYLESGFGDSVVAELKRRGHKVRFDGGGFGGYQAIARQGQTPQTQVYFGASESRKDGQAAGY
ncbi:MAG: gamma-glutamyltransferase [Lysobacterales bacterium]